MMREEGEGERTLQTLMHPIAESREVPRQKRRRKLLSSSDKDDEEGEESESASHSTKRRRRRRGRESRSQEVIVSIWVPLQGMDLTTLKTKQCCFDYIDRPDLLTDDLDLNLEERFFL